MLSWVRETSEHPPEAHQDNQEVSKSREKLDLAAMMVFMGIVPLSTCRLDSPRLGERRILNHHETINKEIANMLIFPRSSGSEASNMADCSWDFFACTEKYGRSI